MERANSNFNLFDSMWKDSRGRIISNGRSLRAFGRVATQSIQRKLCRSDFT